MADDKRIVLPFEASSPEELADAADTNPPIIPDKDEDTNKDVVSIEDKEYILNEGGDAVNEDGTVFKTKEEIVELNKVNNDTNNDDKDKDDDKEQVEIENVVYTLDENGNAVDDKGEVSYTKDQLGDLEDDADEDTGNVTLSLDNIKTKINIPMLDKDGKELSYENTEEGMVSYVGDVQKTSFAQGSQAGVENLISTYPVLDKVLNHLTLNNGNLEGFKDNVTYRNVKIDPENKEQIRNIVVTAEMTRGRNREEAEKLANYYKDDNALEDAGKSSLDYLQKLEKSRDDAEAQQLEDYRKGNQLQQDDYWGVGVSTEGKVVDLTKTNSIYDIVTKKGEVTIRDKNYEIPMNIRVKQTDGSFVTKTRDEFFNYMFVPIEVNTDQGVQRATLYEIDLHKLNQNRSNDEDVFEALQVFTGYDNTQFIESAVNKQKVAKIRKLRAKQTDTKGRGADNKGVKPIRKVVIPSG